MTPKSPSLNIQTLDVHMQSPTGHLLVSPKTQLFIPTPQPLKCLPLYSPNK